MNFVTEEEIAERLSYAPATVHGWRFPKKRDRIFPPFPPPRRFGPHGRLFWEWHIVEAWYERTHLLKGVM